MTTEGYLKRSAVPFVPIGMRLAVLSMLFLIAVLPAHGDDCFVSTNGADVLYLTGVLSSNTSSLAQTIVADLDQDGRPDVILSGLGPTILYNRGTAFEATRLTAQVASGSVAGVINGSSGHPELVMSNLAVVRDPGTPIQTDVPAPASVFSASRAPNIVFADFNGDGRTDAAFWSPEDYSIHVFLGQEDSSFTAAAVIPAGYQPLTLAAIDLDHDGRPDLILDSTATLGVLWNTGNLTFSTAYFTVSDRVSSIAATKDAAGDSHLLVTYPTALVEMVADAQRNLRETTRVDMPGALYLTSGQLVDLDGDGILDAVAAAGSTLAVRWGASNGTFGPAQLYGLPNGKDLTIADLNGDGAMDIIPFQYPGDSLAVVWGIPGQHSLRSSAIHPVRDPAAVANGDLNGDGIPDSIRRPDLLHFAVWFGDGNGGYTPGPVYPTTSQAGGGFIADFDGDHHGDFLLAYSDSSMDVFFGDGTGHFAATPLHIPPYSVLSLANRLDNGASSLLVTDLPPNNQSIQEIRISSARVASGPVMLVSSGYLAALLNIDSGGASEIVTSDGHILKQTGSGWTDAITLPADGDSVTRNIVAADFNGDGLMDFFDPGGPGALSGKLYLASASGYMRQSVNMALPFATQVGLAAAEDVDGDGRPDLILVAGTFSGFGSELAWVLHNTADLGFVPGPAYPAVGGYYGSIQPLDHAVRITNEILTLGCAPHPARIAVIPQSPQPGEGVKLIVQLRELATVSLRENGVEIATAEREDYAPVFTVFPSAGTHVYELRYTTGRGILTDEVTVTAGDTTSHRRTAGH